MFTKVNVFKYCYLMPMILLNIIPAFYDINPLFAHIYMVSSIAIKH